MLALDLHPRRFGYVVLEGPDRLLDWGVCSYRHKGNSSDVLIQRRLRPLLALWRPTLLIIGGTRQMPPRQKLPREKFLKGVAAEAKESCTCPDIKKWPTDRAEKLNEASARTGSHRAFFLSSPKHSRQKRKPWESEHYSTSNL